MDPLDGTGNFIRHLPWFGVGIALATDDLVLLSYSDRATLEKLDLWREQRANEPPRL